MIIKAMLNNSKKYCTQANLLTFILYTFHSRLRDGSSIYRRGLAKGFGKMVIKLPVII